MLISHRHKFIFIHVQKTGGSSITRALMPHCEVEVYENGRRLGLTSHSSAGEIRDVVGPEIWNSYFKFAFDRNPWDRCLSLYYYQVQHWQRYRKPFRPASPTFRQWFYPWGLTTKRIDPGSDLYSIAGKLAVDFLGCFERLSDDFSTICEKIGLPKIELGLVNRSELRQTQDYRREFTPAMRRHIERTHHREIALLNYSF